MSTSSRHVETSAQSAWAGGVVFFAGVMLVIVGLFQSLQGLSAILDDQQFVTTAEDVFDFNLSAWGRFHLVLGLIAVVTGIGLLFGQGWARVVGLMIAVLSALLNFMFIPHYPLWALTVIGFDILVMWAISTQIREAG